MTMTRFRWKAQAQAQAQAQVKIGNENVIKSPEHQNKRQKQRQRLWQHINNQMDKSAFWFLGQPKPFGFAGKLTLFGLQEECDEY